MNAPGENLLIEIWKTLTERGIGRLLKPWAIRREGKALADLKRLDLLMIAQAEKDAEDIRHGKADLIDGKIVRALERSVPSSCIDDESSNYREIIQTSIQSALSDQMRREISIAKAIIYAENEILFSDRESQESSKSEENRLDQDWIYRWRDYASGVSSDELSSLWGRVLAGEFTKPGSYSLRTLDFIKNISPDEIDLIQLLGPYVMGYYGFIFAERPHILELGGLSFQKIFDLQELGIIAGSQAQPIDYYINSENKDNFRRALICNEKCILVNAESAAREPKFKAYCLTKIGKEIHGLGSFKANLQYMREFCFYLKSAGFKTQIGNWSPGEGNLFILNDLIDI